MDLARPGADLGVADDAFEADEDGATSHEGGDGHPWRVGLQRLGHEFQADDRENDARGQVQGQAEHPLGHAEHFRSHAAEEVPGSRQCR